MMKKKSNIVTLKTNNIDRWPVKLREPVVGFGNAESNSF